MMGGGTILLVMETTSEVEVEMMILDTSMVDNVTGGKMIVRIVVEVRYTMTPSNVASHVSSTVSVMTGKLIVVGVDSVHGGKTSTHGGSQVTVGVGSLQIVGSI
jgi:hypothetical protein